MSLNELIEVINEGGEIRDAVSEAIGEYSTDDPNQIFDVMVSNIARTLVEDVLDDESVFRSLVPDLDISKEEVKEMMVILCQKVVDHLKEL